MSRENNGWDWELAKALWFKRTPFAEIIAQTGVTYKALSKRASRGGWVALRAKTEQITPARRLTLRERGELVRENLATDLQVSTEKLPGLKRSADPLVEKERQGIVGSIVSAADKVFSWSETNPLGKNPFDLWSNLESAWWLDQEAGVWRRNHETKPLTGDTLAMWEAERAAKQNPLIIDIPPNGNGHE